MMESDKILLGKSRGRRSVNTSEGVSVSLCGVRRQLPIGDLSENISEYEQYMAERKASNKIRLTLQVNPICTNVLFNSVTEIVKDEGSLTPTFINKGYNTKDVGDVVGNKSKLMSFWSQYGNAIKDTQL